MDGQKGLRNTVRCVTCSRTVIMLRSQKIFLEIFLPFLSRISARKDLAVELREV